MTPAELERVRLHPYLTDRMLAGLPALAHLRRLVARNRERLDGSAEDLYPRVWLPNTVGGQRVGQCVVAPPIDSPSGVSPGAF